MKYKCLWCGEMFIKELVFKKNDTCICFACVLKLASATVSYIQANTADLREIEKKIEEDKGKE